MGKRTKTRMVAAGVAVALILASRSATAEAPVHLMAGDAAPFDGVLTSTGDAARLAAEVLASRQLVADYENRLGECLEDGRDAQEEALDLCRGELDACYSNVGRVEEREVVPWWAWVAVGAALGIGVGVGYGLGSL